MPLGIARNMPQGGLFIPPARPVVMIIWKMSPPENRNVIKIKNVLLLVQLSESLEHLDGTESEKREHLRQSIEVQEQIIFHCDDSEVRGAVLFNIADAYYRYGALQLPLVLNSLPCVGF